MRRLLFILVVLVAGLAALGYYRGWFTVSDSAVTVDKEKVQEDEAKAKAKLEGLKGQAEDKADELKKEGTAKAGGDGRR
jgi:beta-lactam-binding protein with PASTA domain